MLYCVYVAICNSPSFLEHLPLDLVTFSVLSWCGLSLRHWGIIIVVDVIYANNMFCFIMIIVY